MNTEMIIETERLNFGFSKDKLNLRQISLQIKKGSIYGFLGQNGAGKTTTIRLLLGLLENSQPNIRLFGKDIATQAIQIFGKTGAFIESPSLYQHLSGYDNMLITATLRDIPKTRIEEVLGKVNLKEAMGMRVARYSLGMKQRLAIGLALLGDPELLILDEPTNGLDPVGINETRELLIRLNREHGTTIMISSHMLSEIEKMVTHLGILNRGELVFQGEINELKKQYLNKPDLEQIYLSIIKN